MSSGPAILAASALRQPAIVPDGQRGSGQETSQSKYKERAFHGHQSFRGISLRVHSCLLTCAARRPNARRRRPPPPPPPMLEEPRELLARAELPLPPAESARRLGNWGLRRCGCLPGHPRHPRRRDPSFPLMASCRDCRRARLRSRPDRFRDRLRSYPDCCRDPCFRPRFCRALPPAFWRLSPRAVPPYLLAVARFE